MGGGTRAARDDAPETSAGSFIRELVGEIARVSSPRVDDAGDAELIGQTVGRYRVVSLLGKGGMGRVYEAEDIELGRRVAIKFLPASASSRAERVGRFLRERSVTAELEHPGIVPVYDSGVWSNGQPFYVMRKVGGAPLDRLMDRASTLEERLALLGNVLAVADAVGFAHHHGVIHRDLKPSNVLVASFGETLVADWGLAKRVRDEERTEGDRARSDAPPGATREGSVLGTPAYMAPEQARGDAVDERADVYAIGAMLHELVSGRPPPAHDATTAVEGAGRPAGALGANERVKGTLEDLVAIVNKALAPNPNDRYANATELADELRRFHMGKLVGARRYSRAELLRRWALRHRSLLVLGVALGAVIVAVAVISVARIVRERDAANRARSAMEAARREAAERNDVLVLLQARSELDRDPTSALAWLEAYPPSSPDWSAVSEIASDAWTRGVARHVWRGAQPFTARALAFSPDGALLVAGSKEKGLHAWEPSTGKARWLASDVDLGGPVVFSPDGNWIASSDGSTSVRVWDAATGARRTIDAMSGARLRFSDDGALLFGAGFIEGAHVYDVATGELRAIAVDGRAPTSAALLPGRHAAAILVGDALSVVDLDRGARKLLARVPVAPLRGSIDVSPDGRWIALGAPSAVLLYDARTGAARVFPHAGYRTANVRFTPQGELVSFGGNDRILRWDLDAGSAEEITIPDAVRAIAWSPSGAVLVGGENSHLALFEALGEPPRLLLGHRAAIAAAAFSADGLWAASSSADQTLRVWRVGEGDRRVIHGAGSPALLSRDGRTLLGGRPGDWAVKIVDVASGDAELLSGPRSWAWSASGAISPDGRRVLVSDVGQTLSLVDLASKQRRTLAQYGPPGVLDITEDFSPDGSLVAVGSNDGSVQVVNVATGQRRVLGKHDGSPSTVKFSPDGRTLFSAARDRLIKIWDLDGASPPRVLRGHAAEVFDVKPSPDGRRIVSSSADGTVRVWDIERGDARIFRGHSGAVESAAFTPDGRYVVSGGADRTVRIWDAASGEGRVLRRSVAPIWAVAVTDDGASVLYSGEEGSVHLVDPFANPAFERDPARLQRWMRAETTAVVDANGALESRDPR